MSVSRVACVSQARPLALAPSELEAEAPGSLPSLAEQHRHSEGWWWLTHVRKGEEERWRREKREGGGERIQRKRPSLPNH